MLIPPLQGHSKDDPTGWTDPDMKLISIQDVENIILKGRNGRGLLEALTRGRVLKNSERIQLNQVLVSHLIEEHGWK